MSTSSVAIIDRGQVSGGKNDVSRNWFVFQVEYWIFGPWLTKKERETIV